MNKLISCIFLFCLWMPSAISQTDRSVDLLYGEWFLKQDHKSKESDSLLFIRNNPANLDKLGGMDVSYELSWTFHENLTVSESEVFANALQYHRTYNWTLNEGDSVLLVSKSKKYFIERLTGDTLCLINMKPQSFTNSELESFLLESDLKVCSWIDSIYDLQVIKLTNDSWTCKNISDKW